MSVVLPEPRRAMTMQILCGFMAEGSKRRMRQTRLSSGILCFISFANAAPMSPAVS